MKSSDRNLRTTLITTAVFTAGLVWLLRFQWQWDFHWLWFVFLAAVFAGSLLRNLNRADVEESQDDKPRDHGAHLNP